ncbi:MAG: hypothetical protein WC109_00480 [Syntrophomonadaceae bacterium]|nr:hypothetical protein [Syntrophomonadaceae bacterium]MDD3270866.1 hypothetical protein [Syntrophomonadaceae bacterium]MDD3898410.1 hypothetical protein [Syntrophomonadaceae bacterium]MDD4563176.1 hypothetical protein [Syntrophomonadaceae bacterium]
MYRLSRFNCIDGKPDEDQVEVWAESYFYSIMNILNAFFCQVDVPETIDRMSCIPFDQLVAEELEDESPEVITIAVKKTLELLEMEMELLRAYLDDAGMGS